MFKYENQIPLTRMLFEIKQSHHRRLNFIRKMFIGIIESVLKFIPWEII